MNPDIYGILRPFQFFLFWHFLSINCINQFITVINGVNRLFFLSSYYCRQEPYPGRLPPTFSGDLFFAARSGRPEGQEFWVFVRSMSVSCIIHDKRVPFCCQQQTTYVVLLKIWVRWSIKDWEQLKPYLETTRSVNTSITLSPSYENN